MPGSLPNTTIKNALDQAIQAINDLELSFSGGDISLSVETTELTAKLEEIRTLYETESLAQTVAQNANFADLISAMADQTAAISALVLSCETIVNTTNLYQTISSGGGCGGGGGGTDMPPVMGTDPETPPTGWGAADPAIPDRRCKACNRLVDGLDSLLTKLVENNVRELGALGTFVVVDLFITFLTLETGPLAIILGILGGVAAAVVAFLAGGVRPEFMLGLINDELIRKDMVCALYNAGNADQGLTDFLQVWDDNGANNPEYYFIQTLLSLSGATNSIDYSRGGSEVDLSSYVPTVDCDDCGGPDWWNCLVGDVVSNSLEHVVISAVIADGDYSANLSVPGMAESWNITLVSGTLNTPAGVPESVTRWSDLEGAGCGTSSGNPQWNEVLGTVQLGSYPSITAFALRSSTAFSIRIERL